MLLVPTLRVVTNYLDALRHAMPQSGRDLRSHAERGNEG